MASGIVFEFEAGRNAVVGLLVLEATLHQLARSKMVVSRDRIGQKTVKLCSCR